MEYMMNLLGKALMVLCSLPNTVYFNFHYFNFSKAVRLPVLVSYKVKLLKLGEKGSIDCPDKSMSIKLGFSDGSFSMGRKKCSTFCHEKGAKVKFHGKAVLCNPFYITINHGGILSIGNYFQSNTNFLLSCANNISFESECLVGWNVTIIDGDGHSIYRKNSNQAYNLPQPIVFGEHVWISSNSTILKGTIIPNDTIISSNALLTSKFEEEGTIIGGIPAKKIKSEIYWKEQWLI